MSAIVNRVLDAKDDNGKWRRARSRAEMEKSPAKVTEAEAKKIARDVLRRDKPISRALEAAGYSKKQAGKGMSRVKDNQILRRAFAEEKAKILAELAESGPELNSDQTERLIVNRLKDNIVRGKDVAVMSAKLLGSHKKLALWEADSRTGVILVSAPQTSLAICAVPEDPE
jgi:acyl transferase domain-containing protein